ncbi:MAG TPA: type VI secretion system-associated FHA domain protein TagH [Allosphingosinicella sp.]|nr:type VI secretion system-associated FHA domain protein TagH [Allosphingosinicella sp.]
MGLILTVRNAGTLPGDPIAPFSMDGDLIVIGRSRNCDWHLPDPTNAISSRHCEVRRDGETWLIKDISTNGTFLNAAADRLPSEHRLAHGDIIRIGHYEIVASFGEAKTILTPAVTAAAAAPAPPAEERENLTVFDAVADFNKVDWAKGGFGLKDAAPKGADAASVDELVQALLQAAGLTADQVPHTPELIGKAGALLKRLVAGLLVMVEARARAKAQMGAEMTGLQLEGNNPIKFARSPDQALAQLLRPGEPGFMDADRAVEDAFLDLQSHQVATLKAIPGALRATLDRFSPGSIRRRRGHDLGLLAKILPAFRDAALWRHYEAEFVEVKKASDEAFMEVFAKEFRKAYDRQLRQGIR